MILFVDFNMMIDGLVPVRSIPYRSLDETFIAADGEGLECDARIAEVSSDGLILMLKVVDGTFRESTHTVTPS